MLEPPAPKAAEKKAEKVVEQPKVPKSTIPPPIVKMERPPTEPLFEKQLFDAVDISKLPNVKEPSAGGVPAGNGRADSAVAAGKGPGGATMYVAEWVREPTDQELRYYVKDKARNGGEALIACRTVARNWWKIATRSMNRRAGPALPGRWSRRRGSSGCGRRASTTSRKWAPGCRFYFTYTVQEVQGPSF